MQIDNKEKTKRADGFSTRQTTQTRIHSFVRSVHFRYIIIPSVILSTITFASAISPSSWVVSDADHFYFEIFAVILSTIVAFYCITRAYTLNEKFSLFVGIGFSTIAIIDLLHAVFSYLYVGNNEFLSYFIPQTWFAGRTFLGAMLVIAVAKYATKIEKQGKQQIEGNNEDKNHDYDINIAEVKPREERLHRGLLLSLSVLALLAISVVAISFFTIFPGIVIPYSSLARPYENPSLILFSIALFLFYKKRLYNTNDAFYKGILGALIIDVFGQIVMSFSSTNFHTAHNVAHILKNSGYFIIILSLAVSSIQLNKLAKQREATIRLQYNKLKEMDKMKDEFINVAAHELRTPIQPIIGLSEVLRSRIRNNDSGNGTNAENQEYVDVILRNGQRLGKLVEDVLDVTKIESQSLELHKEHFDLNDLIISIIDDIVAAEADSMVYGLPARRKEKNHVKINYVPRSLPIYADRNRVTQVISNLLNNALKFTSEGYVTITTEKKKDNNSIENSTVAVVNVCDSGSG
ncbi:MAG TPA: histidine kinase dimerization/phospho-acceptor domain-containing protein, partial [Nitrososphaera sp.]|nr:histidine kinase dimerization/phospho-acceptor domain-containing protein [Nitrososphaera sp.]